MGKSHRTKKNKGATTKKNGPLKLNNEVLSSKGKLKRSSSTPMSSRTKNSTTKLDSTKKKDGSQLVTKYRFADGEEIEGVNNYKVTGTIRKTKLILSSDIYSVKEVETDEESRMKVNVLDFGAIKREASLLKKLSKINDKNFLKLLEYGALPKKKLEFIIVSPFGITLYEIVTKILDDSLSFDCGINVALEMLRAIQDLHSIGFIHRNISPNAFHCGLGQNESAVILVDFRAYRKYQDTNKKPLAPRSKVKYFGIVRFCSRSCHKEEDQSRKDDLESWLYTIFYLMDKNSLSWSKEVDRSKVLASKEEFMRNECPTMYRRVKPELKPLINLIGNLTFESEPDYNEIIKSLKSFKVDNPCFVANWQGKAGLSKEFEGDSKRSADNLLTGECDNENLTKRANKKGSKRPPRKKLNPNDCIRSEGNKTGWQVACLLGSGGFGDVYKVFKEGGPTDKCYALKTESEIGEKRYLRLKVEVTVMMKTNEKGKHFEHFIEFVDRGKCEQLKCKFVVMGLVGPSIEDIRKKYILSEFSKNTLFNIYIQTVKAVRDLHSLGYLHRDIKPANYAVGLNEHESVIYMLDFGIAKLYVDQDGNHKVPRKKVKFLGTLRYASRACMKLVEQGRKDDLECWLFMVFDLSDDMYGIPWRRIAEPKAILKSKEDLFENNCPEVYKKLPKVMSTLVTYINKLEHESAPDYVYIIQFLETCAKDNGIKVDKKLDWIGKLKKKVIEESESEKSAKRSGEGSE